MPKIDNVALYDTQSSLIAIIVIFKVPSVV